MRMLDTHAIELNQEFGLQSAHGIVLALLTFRKQRVDFV